MLIDSLITQVLPTLSPAFSVISIALLVAYLVHLYSLFSNISEPPPYGSLIPFFGCILPLILSPQQYLLKCKQTQGMFNLYVLGKIVTVIAQESHANVVYKTLNFYDALKHFQIDKVVGERTIPYNRVPFLHFVRQKLVPKFFDSALIMNEPMAKEFIRLSDVMKLNTNKQCIIDDVLPFMTRILIVMNTHIILGEQLSNDIDFIDDLCAWGKLGSSVIKRPSLLGVFARRRCDQCRMRILRRMIVEAERILNETDRTQNDVNDVGKINDEKVFFEMFLLNSRDDKSYTIEIMCEKVLGILYGAVANTPMVACNTLLFILRDQSDVLERVRDEIETARRMSSDRSGGLSPIGIQSMVLLEFCIEESIRILGPPVHARQTDRALTLPNTSITLPQGRLVVIAPSLIHLNPSIFPQRPTEFIPDRFRREQNLLVAQRRTSPMGSIHHSLLNWSRGRHKCYGRQLALNEIKMLISLMLTSFNISAPGENVAVDFLTTGTSVLRNRKLIVQRCTPQHQ